LKLFAMQQCTTSRPQDMNTRWP